MNTVLEYVTDLVPTAAFFGCLGFSSDKGNLGHLEYPLQPAVPS
jgi:hypothetical protein